MTDTAFDAALVARINEGIGWRKERGRTIGWPDFALQLRWTAEQLTHYRMGVTPLTVRDAATIAAMLGVRAAWLAFGEGRRSRVSKRSTNGHHR